MENYFKNYFNTKQVLIIFIALFSLLLLLNISIAEENNEEEILDNEINETDNFKIDLNLEKGINILSYKDEFYSFNKIPIITCNNNLNKTSLENSLYCFDDNRIYQLNTNLWNETCVISIYDASNPYCSKVRIISEFNENNNSELVRLTKEIDIEQTIIFPENVLSRQRWDGGFGNPIDTSIAIWLLSDFGNLYKTEIENAIDWLNINRNNRDKCWPSSSCTAYETSVVMAYLTLAGLNDSSRIYYDGRVWLENHQNYIPNVDYGISISTGTNENNCTLYIDSSSQEITNFNRSDDKFFSFSPDYGLNINLSCDYRVTLSILDERNISIYTSSNSRDVKYTFPRGACWSVNQWQSCNDVISVYATIVNLSDERKELAEEYLELALIRGSFVGKYVQGFDRILHSALYYHYIEQDSSVAEYLVFNQNNDGSYDEGSIEEKVSRTLHVVQALRKENLPFTRESIIDSLKWLFSKDPFDGFNDILSDTLVYFTLKQTDLNSLYFNDGLIILNDDKDILLNNPFDKSYNLTYYIQGELNKAIEVEMVNSLESYNDLEISLIKKNISSGNYPGFLYILNTHNIDSNFSQQNISDFEKIFKIPIIVEEKPYLEYDFSNEITILGSTGKFKISNINTNDNFNCEAILENDEKDDKEINMNNFELLKNDNEIDIELNLGLSERDSFLLEGFFICESKSFSNIFEKEFNINVEQYPYDVVGIEENEIYINKRRDVKQITLKNLINETIEVKIELGNLASAYFVLEKNDLILEPNSQVEINIFNNIERRTDVVFSDEVKINSLGQKINIPFESNIVYVPFFETRLFRIIIYILIILFFLSIMKIIHYYSDDIKKYFDDKFHKKENDYEEKSKNPFSKLINKLKQKLPKKLKEVLKIKNEEKEDNENDIEQEKTIHHSGVESMIKIMMDLNHEEKDIIKRLKKEGLTEDEINESLKNVNEELEVKREIEREESVIKVIKKMDEDSDTVRSLLKQSGFSDEQINQAFEEIEEELAHKEEELQKHLAQFKEDDEDDQPEEVSLLDTEKNKNQED